MAGTVPLHPDSFAADGGLLDLSMEEVVALFLDKEKRRRRDARDDEGQQEVVVGVASAPMGLTAVLDIASHRLGISRSMLTRCLSHQVAGWYDSLGTLRELTDTFYTAYQKAVDRGHPDLCGGLRESGYSFVGVEIRPTSFRTISWVWGKLGGLSLSVGLPAKTLFLVGLCESVTTTDSGLYAGTVDKLRGEVDRFLSYIGERFIKVRAFHSVVNHRLERSES